MRTTLPQIRQGPCICCLGSGKAPAPSPPVARDSGHSGSGDHARGRPLLSRLSERRRVRRRGGGAGGGCQPSACCVGAAGSASDFSIALAQAMQGAGHVQGMGTPASNSLWYPPTRGCAAMPAFACGSTTSISPGMPSHLRSDASGRHSAGQLTPRFSNKGKIAANCAIAPGGCVLKWHLGILVPEAAGAREAASS